MHFKGLGDVVFSSNYVSGTRLSLGGTGALYRRGQNDVIVKHEVPWGITGRDRCRHR